MPVAALSRRAVGLRGRLVNKVGRINHRVANGTVALTFDDGPKPGSTDRILDLLAELEVTATFFCLGRNALEHPELIRRMRAEGHAVGSHSFSHPDPEVTSIGALAREYARGRRAVAEVLGEDTQLFRPPRGHLKPASAVLVRRQNLQTWIWSVNPEDWRPGVAAEDIVAVASQATAGDVVLLHDWIEQPWAASALDRSATVAALPDIVARIRKRGLALDNLLP